jgi:hypothetical protein
VLPNWVLFNSERGRVTLEGFLEIARTLGALGFHRFPILTNPLVEQHQPVSRSTSSLGFGEAKGGPEPQALDLTIHGFQPLIPILSVSALNRHCSMTVISRLSVIRFSAAFLEFGISQLVVAIVED